MPLIPDRHQLHREVAINVAPSAPYVELASAAGDGRLALYVGAGISVPTPTLLPTSDELLALLAPIVEQELGVRLELQEAEEDDPVDGQVSLEKLADQAEQDGVLPAFRDLAASVVPFRDAPANYSHRAAALLLREGSVSVFSVNWDRCIERGAAQVGFYIDATVTEADRAIGFAACRFHKIHGCAAQPPSLLITSSDLDEPPGWVEHMVGAEVGAKTIVFVGLGTVGGYVRARVAQVLDVIGDDAAVWLADPYPSQAWEQLLARVSERILEVDANRFFDDLLRACVRHAFAQLVSAARAMDAGGWDPPTTPSAERLVEALSARRAVEILGWMRGGAGGVGDGSPLLHSPYCRTALLALASVAAGAPLQTRGDHEQLVVQAGAAMIELAVWPESRADVMVERETARVSERYDRGCYGVRAPAVFHICVGHRGLLARPDVPADIGGGEAPEGDLLESEPVHYWIPADSVLQGTFAIPVPA
jgi:hypothetical protein